LQDLVADLAARASGSRRRRFRRRLVAEAGGGRRRPASGEVVLGRVPVGERELVRERERERFWGRTKGSGTRPLRERGAGQRRGVDFG
jgi:hypothetical protein